MCKSSLIESCFAKCLHSWSCFFSSWWRHRKSVLCISVFNHNLGRREWGNPWCEKRNILAKTVTLVLLQYFTLHERVQRVCLSVPSCMLVFLNQLCKLFKCTIVTVKSFTLFEFSPFLLLSELLSLWVVTLDEAGGWQTFDLVWVWEEDTHRSSHNQVVRVDMVWCAAYLSSLLILLDFEALHKIKLVLGGEVLRILFPLDVIKQR